MFSRRRILKLGTAAAGAAFASPVMAAPSENTCPALPPSIASLKSMKDQAKPISTEERGERQEKARRLMADNKLDAILLTEGTSLTYFSGIHWGGGERLFAMVLPAKGNAFYVCPAFEEGRAREQIAKAPGADQADVRIWQEDESPYQRVAQGLEDRRLSTGTLGMEETVRFVFSQGIGKASPQVKIATATPVTAGCRMIKSDHEVELMRLAAEAAIRDHLRLTVHISESTDEFEMFTEARGQAQSEWRPSKKTKFHLSSKMKRETPRLPMTLFTTQRPIHGTGAWTT